MFSSRVRQAHIHCGEPGINGPVIAFLFGFNAAGVDGSGVLAEGVITASDVRTQPVGTTGCPDGVANFAELINRLRSGGAYTSVHTLVFPGGEIRGAIG